MLPGKITTPSAAALVVAGNKATPASPSVRSAKQAPAAAAAGLVLAVDGKRSVATLSAVVGRGPAFSDDDLKPKGFSAEEIIKMVEETSSLLRGLCVPKQSSFPEQVCFSNELEALRKACAAMAEGAGVDEDGAINMLLGVHARIKVLVLSRETPREVLLSSMEQSKASVEDYIWAQDKIMQSKASVEDYIWAQDKIMTDGEGRTSLHDMVKNSSVIEPTPTVCSDDEVKAVLEKTLELLEASDPVHSTTGMSGLFYKVRSNCRALMKDVEKKGVDSKTGSAIALVHISILFVLGQNNKYFSYQDAADDSLLSSLRRLEVALRDYKLGGPAAPSE